MEQLPERHIECSECKRPIAVCYTEIVGKTIYRLGMCAVCPKLLERLHGMPATERSPSGEVVQAGLCCGNCGTQADEVKMGVPLGCSLCYEVFDDLLTQELVLAEHLMQRYAGGKGLAPLHLGRQPGQAAGVNLAQKLLSLHQALNETLSREDYEQAAWLRDQIKALTEEGEDGQKPNVP